MLIRIPRDPPTLQGCQISAPKYVFGSFRGSNFRSLEDSGTSKIVLALPFFVTSDHQVKVQWLQHEEVREMMDVHGNSQNPGGLQ